MSKATITTQSVQPQGEIPEEGKEKKNWPLELFQMAHMLLLILPILSFVLCVLNYEFFGNYYFEKMFQPALMSKISLNGNSS